MRDQRTALVLSAGGMFGAYQAGAYKAIAGQLKIDLVVGTSVGALNGWLIAAGSTPEHLIDRWLDPACGHALQLLAKPGWRNGWFDPEPLRLQARRLFHEYEPRVPFGLVVVELPRLNAKLVRHTEIRPEHLAATCSIPVFLPPVRVNGKSCLDGGLFEKLPIWAALEMGATRIIAIDSLPDIDTWWLHLGFRAARLFKKKRRFPRELELNIISPSEALGDVRDAVFWKEENVKRWIDLGARDAARMFTTRAFSAGEPVTETAPSD